jgi:hypothetical protein
MTGSICLVPDRRAAGARLPDDLPRGHGCVTERGHVQRLGGADHAVPVLRRDPGAGIDARLQGRVRRGDLRRLGRHQELLNEDLVRAGLVLRGQVELPERSPPQLLGRLHGPVTGLVAELHPGQVPSLVLGYDARHSGGRCVRPLPRRPVPLEVVHGHQHGSELLGRRNRSGTPARARTGTGTVARLGAVLVGSASREQQHGRGSQGHRRTERGSHGYLLGPRAPDASLEAAAVNL